MASNLEALREALWEWLQPPVLVSEQFLVESF